MSEDKYAAVEMLKTMQKNLIIKIGVVFWRVRCVKPNLYKSKGMETVKQQPKQSVVVLLKTLGIVQNKK